MMYLTHVEIWNFRTHVHTALELSPGVNAFVGKNASGKSNCLSAIQWCLTNHLSGEDFIRIGEKEARVRVSLSNGYVIERQKGRAKTNNFYRLFKDGVLIEEFTGFGRGVPPAIREAHGMTLDEQQSMNFHGQLESAFLVGNTPAQRADYIGNIEELSKVDRAMGGINEDIRDANKELKRLQLSIDAREKDVEALENALLVRSSKKETLYQLIETLEQEQRVHDNLSAIAGRAEELARRQVELRDEIAQLAGAAEGFPDSFRPEDVNRLYGITNELAGLEARLTELKEAAELDLSGMNEYIAFLETSLLSSARLEQLASKIAVQEEERRKRRSFLTDEVEHVATLDFSAVDRTIESYTLLFHRHKQAGQLESEHAALERKISEAEAETNELLDELLERLTEQGHCDTCGQSTKNLTHDCVEQTI